MPQPAIMGQRPIDHLADNYRAHPTGLPRLGWGHHIVEPALDLGEGLEFGAQSDQHGLGEAGSDVAEVAQPTLRVVRGLYMT